MNSMQEFARIKRLPPYVFNEIGKIKMQMRRAGADIIDFSMGNPDLKTPPHIVEKLREAAELPYNHRYSVSRGIPNLRKAICERYAENYGVDLDPEEEAIVTIGSKEGIAHLSLAMLQPGDLALAPDPTYPIHRYAPIIAGAEVAAVPMLEEDSFLRELRKAVRHAWPKPKVLFISFPHNPTGFTTDEAFFQEIADFAKANDIWVIHDFAYADIAFDGHKPPSFLKAKGAREAGVEFYSLSKSFSMPGWRIGFCLGNKKLIHALGRIKSYLDYGIFQPLQIAATVALRGPQECVAEVANTYRERRDKLIEAFHRAGWDIQPPKATMFVWAKIPDKFANLGSLEFSRLLLQKANVAVSPGIGFGEYGDSHVRIALIENEHRIRQAANNIKKAFEEME